MKMTNPILRTMLLVSIALTIASCDESEPQIISDSDNFLPLEDGRQWTYQRKLISTGEDGMVWVLDTLELKINGDTLVEGHRYKKIVNDKDEIQKIVRNEGSKYFGRNHDLYLGYSHEYIYFDTELPVGSSWSYLKDDGATKTEYTIKAKKSTQVFFDKIYTQVIEVQATYYDMIEPTFYSVRYSTKHYYAKGVGEIYYFYPYPASLFYADLAGFIINTEISD